MESSIQKRVPLPCSWLLLCSSYLSSTSQISINDNNRRPLIYNMLCTYFCPVLYVARNCLGPRPRQIRANARPFLPDQIAKEVFKCSGSVRIHTGIQQPTGADKRSLWAHLYSQRNNPLQARKWKTATLHMWRLQRGRFVTTYIFLLSTLSQPLANTWKERTWHQSNKCTVMLHSRYATKSRKIGPQSGCGFNDWLQVWNHARESS